MVCTLAIVGATIGVPVSAQSANTDRVPVVVVFADQSAKNSQAITASDGRVTGGGSVDVAPVLFARVPEQAREAIANRPGVEAVSRDVSLTTFAQTTDWGVEAVGARSTATGVNESGVTVAVIDTGIDSGHTDLGDSVSWGADTVGSGYTQGRDTVGDGNGHGTHVAGIIAAQDNERGTVGVAPGARLYAMKALADDGTGTLSDVIEAMDLSLKGPDGTVGTSDDADVLSLSLGTDTDSAALESAITSASDHAVVVAAAGNAGDGGSETNTVQYPAKYADAIAVAAADQDDTTPQWSSEGTDVALAAPGVDVVSTFPGNEYRSLSGTSMATPHVAGTAALYIAATEARTGATPTATDVQTALTETARDIETSGDDTLSGAGLVQAAAIDTETPAGEIVTPTEGETVAGNTTIAVDARHSSESPENLSVAYAIDDGAWQSLAYDATSEQFTAHWNTTAVEDGAHRLWIWIGDSDGDSVNASRSVQVANTGSVPTAAFAAPTDGQTVRDTQQIRLTASDEQTARENLSVSFRIDDRDWRSVTYSADAEAFTGDWNVSAEDPGKYTVTGYVENADGVATTTQIIVYRENETAAPGEQLTSIAELVQAELAGDLQGRAFGQRIAAAASDRQRADVAADHQARLERQLGETLAEPPSRARDARLRHIQRLSDEQIAVVGSLPPAVRTERGLDEQEVASLRDRSRAVGPPVVETAERPVPADRPPRAGQPNETERSETSDRDGLPRERPPQGPPERDGGEGERGPPADRGPDGSEDPPGQSGETPGSGNLTDAPGGNETETGNSRASEPGGSESGSDSTDDTGGAGKNDGQGNRTGGSDTTRGQGDEAGGSDGSRGQDSGSSGSDGSRGQGDGSGGSDKSRGQGSGNNSLANGGGGPGRS